MPHPCLKLAVIDRAFRVPYVWKVIAAYRGLIQNSKAMDGVSQSVDCKLLYFFIEGMIQTKYKETIKSTFP